MHLRDWPWLILIIILPILHRWWVERNRSAKIIFSIPVPKSKSVGFQFIQWTLALKYFGLILILFSLSRPQMNTSTVERSFSGVETMMLLDVSASMNIEDLAERSRIEVAKDTIDAFIKNRQNDRIGLVIFSGEPLSLVPPTLDYGLLLQSLHDVTVGSLKDGTAIGDGLGVAINHLRSSSVKSRIIILLTDGDNNIGKIDPSTAGEIAAGYGIRVYTIVIGREGRVRMPIRQKTVFGNTISTYQWFENALNPELLQKIAEKTKGKFYRVTDESTLSEVFKEIDHLEKSELKTKHKVQYEEFYQTFLKWGIVVFSMGVFLEWGLWRVGP